MARALSRALPLSLALALCGGAQLLATAAAPSAGEDAKTTVKRENGGGIALERPKRQRAAAVASS